MKETLAPFTAGQLLKLPRGQNRYELVRGELRMMTPASHQHGRIAADVLTALNNFVKKSKIGYVYAAETGFWLEHTPDTVRAPDVGFVTKERAEQFEQEPGFFPGAPDLAIEVLSPDDRTAAVREKVHSWLDAGARLVILIDPKKRTGEIFRANGASETIGADGALDGGDVAPGWTLPLKELFD